MRDLLDLLILFILAHQDVVFVKDHLSLSLDDITDLVLLIPREANFTLVKQGAQKLTSLDLLLELTLADIEKLISALSNYSVVVLLLLALFKLFFFLRPWLFLDHTVHGNIHGFGSVGDATGRLRHQVDSSLDRFADKAKHTLAKTDGATLDTTFFGAFYRFDNNTGDGGEYFSQHRFSTVGDSTDGVGRHHTLTLLLIAWNSISDALK